MEPVTTKITQHPAPGPKKLGNLTLEDAKFWGRPNFAGEMDRFKNDNRKFTIFIPNDAADELRALGWNVRETIPTPERLAQDPEAQIINSLKITLNFKDDPAHPNDVRYEKGPDIWVIMGENREKLTSLTAGLLDRSHIQTLDMEIRAWNYNKEEVDAGQEEPEYSARLVTLVAVIQPSVLSTKYGGLL